MNNPEFISKRFQIILTLLCSVLLLSLIILAFYNHPSADDFFALSCRKANGFWQMQCYIFNSWGGRYTSNAISTIFTTNQFLFYHYYLHTALLIVLQVFSFYFLIFNINRHYLNECLSFSTKFFLSIFFTVTCLSCVIELNTALYWFSSSVTYQFSLISLCITVGLFIRYLFSCKKYIIMVLLAISIFITTGTNEVVVLLQILLLFTIYLFSNKNSSKIDAGKILLLLVIILSLIFSFSSEGNSSRLELISGNRNLVYIVFSLFYRLLQITNAVFSSLICWVVLVFTFCLGVHLKHSIIIIKYNNSRLNSQPGVII